ncbi:MAG TPA: redoxin family protein [Pyrinomonadaceae bacterium]|nr:redoxin family protein [Pyrinomonadaceae bacterium]
MGKFSKYVEVIANVLIVVVAVLCLFLLWQKYFRTQPAPQKTEQANRPAPKVPVVGSKVSAVDVDWSKSKKNVLLVLQVGCRFCSESAEFYQTLMQQTKDKGVSVLAVLPQSKEEARKYLDNLQLSNLDTKQAAMNTLDVSGTPTLIVTDDKGQITNVWVGKLPPEKQNEVLSLLSS